MIYKILISLFLFTVLTACEEEPLGPNYVFIRYKEADMPVWVKGNLQSDVFIILHGA